LERKSEITIPVVVPPSSKKCPVYVFIQRPICEGDSIFINGYWFSKSENTLMGGPDTITMVTIFVLSKRITQKTVTISQGDSVLVNNQWQKSAGVFTDSLQTIHGCDSLVRTEIVMFQKNDCPECIAEREKWLFLGGLSVSGFLMREEHNDWQNKTHLGFGVLYEHKFKDGLLFDPLKKPCIGESIIGALALRGTNDAPPSSDCITCNNLPENASVTVEAKVQYKLSWLKGFPIIPSIAAGPGISYNQGGDPALKWGFIFTPEIEAIVLQKTGVSVFAQTNLSLGSIPNDWRVGVRVHIGRKK
jgi:hypothetical protein